MSRAPLLVLLAALALAAPATAATTFVPDTFGDALPADCSAGHAAGTCSLREAVNVAQDGDIIQLAEGTYSLALDQLTTNHDLTFIGAGTSKTTIRQQGTGYRLFKFETGATVAMTGLTLTGGNVVGGSGANGTSGTPKGGDGNNAAGGAIAAESGTVVTLTLVDVVGNSVAGGNGGDGFSPASGAGGAGGKSGSGFASALDLGGTATLDRVTVAGNTAQGGAAGDGGNGSGSNAGGTGGDAGDGGGAVDGGTALVIRDSTITGNVGTSGKGGNGGNGGASGGAGGDGGRSIRAPGGGVFTNNDLTIVNSTITGNVIHGNDGGRGGNAPLSTGGDGGNAEGGEAGGVAFYNGATGHIASSTIAGNSATAGTPGAGGTGLVHGATGGGGLAYGGNMSVASATLDIRDSVIAGGTATGSPAYSNCSVDTTSVTSFGHNIDSTDQCIETPAAGDKSNTDPKLGALQDNGGPTKTMAPLGDSPLINGGPPVCEGVGTPLTADQRGVPRDATCDIGAYEAVPPRVAGNPSVSGTAATGHTVTCFGALFSGDAPVTFDTVWLRDGQQVGTGGDYAIPPADAGHALACRQTATNAYGSASADSAAVQVQGTSAQPPTGTVVLSKLRVRKGKVTFTLSAPARVRFSLCKFKGKTKVCKRLKKRAPKAIDGKQGANRTRLKLKRLKPGRYRLTATPAGGKAKRATFRVKRRR